MNTPLTPLIGLLKQYAVPDFTPGYVRAFQEEVRTAVADGKLTEEEMAALERRREELGIPEGALAAVRQELYRQAFQAVKEGEGVTDDEWDELEQIQEYLGLKDADIAKTKKELYRMRIMHEIERGNMPLTETPELLLRPGEHAHWNERVALLKRAKKEKGQAPGLLRLPQQLARETLGLFLRTTEAQETGWIKQSSGELIITNKRIVYRSEGTSLSFPLSSIIDVQCFLNGIRLSVNRRAPMMFRYAERGNHNIVGSVLLHAVAYAQR